MSELSKHFHVCTYTGNGVPRNVPFANGEPSLVMVKKAGSGGWSDYDHGIIDTIRSKENKIIEEHKDELLDYLRDKYPEEFI